MCFRSKALFQVFSLVLCLLVLVSSLGSQQSDDLSLLTSSELSLRLSQAENRYETLSTQQFLTLDQWEAELMALQGELTTLSTALGALKQESTALLMELSMLEKDIDSLTLQVASSLQLLENIKEDLSRAKNRATWAIVGGSVALVLAIVSVIVVVKKTGE